MNIQSISKLLLQWHKSFIFIAAILAAVSYFISSPFLFFISFFVFLFQLYKTPTFRLVVVNSFIYGVGFYGLGLFWLFGLSANYEISFISVLFFISIAIIFLMALLIVFPSVVLFMVRKYIPFLGNNAFLAIFLVPFVFTGIEVFKQYYFSGFPWFQASHLLVDVVDFSVVGEMGVSFLFYQMVTFALLLILDNSRSNFLSALFCFVIAYLVVGDTFLKNSFWEDVNNLSNYKTLSIKAIHTNSTYNEKYDLKKSQLRIIRLKKISSMLPKADIVLWPEGISVVNTEQLIDLDQGFDKVKFQESTILWGGYLEGKPGDFYNVILRDNLPSPIYLKQKLIPFAEYMPSFFDFLIPYFPNIHQSDLKTDSRFSNSIDINGAILSPFICFEILFSERVRKQSENADFILLFSDLNFYTAQWFSKYLINIARLRASELGKPLVQVSNKGYTAVIDANGNIINKVAGEEQSLNQRIVSVTKKTIYSQYGILAVVVISIISLLIALFGCFKQNKTCFRYRH